MVQPRHGTTTGCVIVIFFTLQLAVIKITISTLRTSLSLLLICHPQTQTIANVQVRLRMYPALLEVDVRGEAPGTISLMVRIPISWCPSAWVWGWHNDRVARTIPRLHHARTTGARSLLGVLQSPSLGRNALLLILASYGLVTPRK
jgi:hypothetical protein